MIRTLTIYPKSREVPFYNLDMTVSKMETVVNDC